MGSETKQRVQTTILLDPDQEAAIRSLSVQWGDASLASVVRRLLAEALTARRNAPEAGVSEVA